MTINRIGLLGFLGTMLLTGCTASQGLYPLPLELSEGVLMITGEARLASGRVRFDLYSPKDQQDVPLVVVAHGFGRNRNAMAGWGRKLAQEGFVVAVPDAPGWADHPRNGRAIGEIITWLCAESEYNHRFDSSRIGVVGFSNGGLWTLLAAADHPEVKVWVGLDPVDRHNLGASAAPRLKARAVVLKAPPSQWNKNGNCEAIERALPDGWVSKLVPNAVHLDPEWPTDPQAEYFLGKTSDERRMVFVNETVAALKRELLTAPQLGALPMHTYSGP